MFNALRNSWVLSTLSAEVRRVLEAALKARSCYGLGHPQDGAFRCYEVSARIVESLGGNLQSGTLPELSRFIANHTWVRTPEGYILDATIGQFAVGQPWILTATKIRGVYYSHPGCDGGRLASYYRGS